MAKHSTLSLRRIKPEHIQTYINYHKQVWSELLDAYREAGITQIDCFLNGSDLVVYSAYDDIYELSEDTLSHNPVEIRWQALMETLCDSSVEQRSIKEVFHRGSPCT